MESPDAADHRDEAWFIEQLEAEEMSVTDLSAMARAVAKRGRREDADAMAKLLQDELARRGMTDHALDILGLRLGWAHGETEARKLVRAESADLFGPDRRRRELVEHVGLQEDVAAAEAVRRMRVLAALSPGALCYDRTWGFGVVRDLDGFERKVEIDFEVRTGHRMTFAYAAETLQPLDEEHLLARRYRDPDGMAAAVRENPAQVMRWALQSFGSLPVAILQERLSPRLVAPEDWKRFWDAARKELKGDPLVHIPTRRSDPIEMRVRAEDFGREWLQRLAAERDMPRILEDVGAWLAGADSAGASPQTRAVVAERLGFVLTGAGRKHPDLAARAIMMGHTLGVGSDVAGMADMASRLLEPDLLLRTTERLQARDRKAFFEFLDARNAEVFHDLLLHLLPRMDMATFSDAMALLLRAGRDTDCADVVRRLITQPEEAPEALLWLVRNPDRIAAWGPGTPFDWARMLLAALEFEQGGSRLRAQNALRDRVGRVEWMGELFGRMTGAQRRELLLRLRETPAWPALERQALMGLLVKRFPELEAALSGEAPPPAAAGSASSATSLRRYRERQQQLERLITEEIPRNSREIGVARSYGDLRENFEYKAAKDMQTLLLSRRAEWERQLEEVRPTDFEGVPNDRAGPGTGVVIEWPDGRHETFFLLGVWDQDEQMRIVSSEAQLARALLGHVPGDRVDLPDGQGVVRATLFEVLPLPAAIRAWIRGEESIP